MKKQEREKNTAQDIRNMAMKTLGEQKAKTEDEVDVSGMVSSFKFDHTLGVF